MDPRCSMGCIESSSRLLDGILDPVGLRMDPQCSMGCIESST